MYAESRNENYTITCNKVGKSIVIERKSLIDDSEPRVIVLDDVEEIIDLKIAIVKLLDELKG